MASHAAGESTASTGHARHRDSPAYQLKHLSEESLKRLTALERSDERLLSTQQPIDGLTGWEADSCTTLTMMSALPYHVNWNVSPVVYVAAVTKSPLTKQAVR
jgi:hypothetical protein